MSDESGPSMHQPDAFRVWILKEMQLSAELWREEQNRDLAQANIHRGMLRGIRHVAQQLGIRGLDLATLKNLEFELLGFAPEPDELLRPAEGETLASRISHGTYEERWVGADGDEVKIYIGPDPNGDERYIAWADYRGLRWLASSPTDQQDAVDRLLERLDRKDPAFGEDWGPPF